MKSTRKGLETGKKVEPDQDPAATNGVTPGLPRWLIPTLVVLLTVTAFLPVLQNEFVNWDDDINLLDNPNYQGLGWTELRWMFTTFHMSLYRPLTWVTLGLDYLLWGMNPLGYHLTSLLLHATNAVLFYFISLRLLPLAMSSPTVSRDLPLRAAAGFAALVFAIHPLRVEVVAWASARNDVLSGTFFLWTIFCYLRATMVVAADHTRQRWLVAAIVVYALSLLSKSSGMTLPIVLLVLDVYPLGRLGGGPGKWFGPEARRVWWEKVPFLLLGFGGGVIGLVAKHEAGSMIPFVRYGVIPRMVQALFGLTFYLWKTIMPLGLSPLYELPFDLKLYEWPFLPSGIVALAVTIALVVARRRWPAGLAIWVCYVVILAPVLGITQSGPQITADRYSYLSCLGWAILAGAGLLYCWRLRVSSYLRVRTFILAVGLAAVVLAVLWVLTWKQVRVWHASKRLWRHVLAVTQESTVAHNNLGNALASRGELGEAIVHFRQALRIDPTYAEAHNNLGTALTRRGELEEAIGHFRQALRIVPTYAKAHNNLGIALIRRGELEEAIGHFRQALRIQPEFAEAHESLGRALIQQGKRDEAIKHYEEALRIMKRRREASASR